MLTGDKYTLHVGNNLDVLPTLADNSVDSIVTDPPYELGFMGKKWDSSGIAYNVELWRECLRVLKPGGHLLSFGGSRTWHRIAVAIEDAGFEVRDSIAWMYGSGFPKSYNVAKGIEGKLVNGSASWNKWHQLNGTLTEAKGQGANGLVKSNAAQGNRPTEYASHGSLELEATTPEAKQWEGWGTALKPAFEPVIVARKPLIGTVAENVLTYGTGGLNIDGSRIGTEKITINTFDNGAKPFGNAVGEPYTSRQSLGRWPANVILDPYTAELLDEQSDASRFFYVAKASKRDRNEGLEHLEDKRWESHRLSGSLMEDGITDKMGRGTGAGTSKNHHPTVKPTILMQYLIKLVTPPGGTVLDPFTGSGSTGKAAILDGFYFIGIELTEEYVPIIEGRLQFAEKQQIKEEVEALF